MAAAASAQPHVFDMTAVEALDMSKTIKPGVTNFSHFYMPENLDGSNGVYDLPDGTELYAFGDIHGDFDLVVNLLTKVAKVAVQNPDGTFSWSRPNCWVVLVGDMVDRFRAGLTLSKPISVRDPVTNTDISTQRGLGENVDDVGQIQDLLNSLTIQAHFGGQKNNKIIKLLGNHDVTITSDTSLGAYYRQNYTSPYAEPAYNLYYKGLQPARQATYSNNYDDYVKFELAHKLISGNTHVICKIGNWIFVHGGMNTFVLNDLKTNCINNPNIQPLEYISYVNIKFHKFLQTQRTAAVAKANAVNICMDYVLTSPNSPLTNRLSGFAGDFNVKNAYWETIRTCGETEPALSELLNNLGGHGNHLAVAHCVQNQNNFDRSVGQVYEFRRASPLTASDADRLVFASPGVPNQAREYMCGINYICPDNPDSKEGGKIWRLDCGMSRAFLIDKPSHPTFSADAGSCYNYSRSCRPQCLMIKNDHFNPGTYVTYVLLGKKALDIDFGLDKYGSMVNKTLLNHDDNYELNTTQVADPIFGIPQHAPVQVQQPAAAAVVISQATTASRGPTRQQRSKKKNKGASTQFGAAAATASVQTPPMTSIAQPSGTKHKRHRPGKKSKKEQQAQASASASTASGP